MSAIITSFKKLTSTEINIDSLNQFLRFIESETKRRKLKLPEQLIKDKLLSVKKLADKKGIKEFTINTNKLTTQLGKITDVGEVVPGGAVDMYWLAVNPTNYTGEKPIKEKKYFDPKTVQSYFALKSIEFGNWMNQKDRMSFLYAFARSMDILAIIFGQKAERMGLKCKLSVAFGARGVPNSKAHYNLAPISLINLTKKHGHHSLIHEWAHALDNQITVATSKGKTMLTGGESTRKKTDEAALKSTNGFVVILEQIFHLLFWEKDGKPSEYQLRLKKQTDYYNYRAEIFARLMEVYTFYLLQKKGYTNHFLVKKSYANPVYVTKSELKTVNHLIEQYIKLAFQTLYEGKKPVVKLPAKQMQLFGVETTVANKILSIGKSVVETVAAAKTVKQMFSDIPKDLAELVSPIGEKKQPAEYFNLTGPISDFLGKIEKRTTGSVTVTLDGSRGSGKTRFVYQVMNELSSQGLKGLFFSLEEHKDSVLIAEKVKQYISDTAKPNINIISEVPQGFDTILKYAPYYDYIVVDSWQKVPNSYGRLDELRKAINGKIIILIFQQTTAGEMRGGASSAFDADIVLKTDVSENDYTENFVYADKNRYQDKPLHELAYSIYHRKTFNPTNSKDEK